VINPAVVEGQISGGLAQAIGMVLLEEVHIDAQGNPTTVTYKDYLLPAITDVPVFEFVHANTPSKTIGGMRGVGEGGAIIGPPTLVNAIADALSPFGEIEELILPLTPPRILDVIEQRDISGTAAHHAPAAPVAAEPAPAAAPASAVPAGPAQSVDGAWNMALKTPMGLQEMVVTFVTDGAGGVSGRFDSAEGSQEFTGGTVENGRVRFNLDVEKPMKITLKYDLQADGGAITGKCKMGMFGSAKVTGTRA
jgi:carbon-monoxide dehydrogenase large subunit